MKNKIKTLLKHFLTTNETKLRHDILCNFTYRHSYNNFQINTEELKSHKNYVNIFIKTYLQ